MKNLLTVIVPVILSLVVSAQGKVGINTTTPLAMLHVKDSSVVFTGATTLPITPGNIPVSGQGIRMMWYPDKAAFRVGYVTSTNWNKDSIGNYSFACGYNTKATGDYSFASGWTTIASGDFSVALGSGATATGVPSTAIGNGTKASGANSTALGNSTTASGDWSTAMGNGSIASGLRSTALGKETTAGGDYSTALGYQTTASGDYSTAEGENTVSRSYGSFSIGRYNDSIITSSLTSWIATDPLFIIGNGSADNARSNAMTVLKNGNTGINITTPLRPLHVSATTTTTGVIPNADAVIVAEKDGDNAYISINTDANKASGIIFANTNNANDGGIYYNSTGTSYDLRLRTNGNATRMTIDASGNVGMGTTVPTEKLHVIGNICYTGTIGACSDIRYKKNFSPVDHSLSSVLSLHGIYYYWKKDEFPDMQFEDDRQIGFSAQEVEKLFPEVVMTNTNGYKSVDYGRLTPVLVEAIREQQEKMNEQQKKIDALEKEIAEIKKLLIQK